MIVKREEAIRYPVLSAVVGCDEAFIALSDPFISAVLYTL